MHWAAKDKTNPMIDCPARKGDWFTLIKYHQGILLISEYVARRFARWTFRRFFARNRRNVPEFSRDDSKVQKLRNLICILS